MIRRGSGEISNKAANRAIWLEQGGKGVGLVTLLLGVAVFLLPFYVMLAMALKDQSEVATTSMWSWPVHPTLANFVEVLTNPNVSFALFLKNTTFIAVTSTIGVVISSSMAAYGFARVEFAGRDRLFLVLLATMMLPGIVTMIPTYVMYASIGWVNTFKPLIIPAFFGGGAFNIFLLRQFYLGIPRELDEAAVLEMVPLMVGSGGLRTDTALRAEKWHLLMAGSVLVIIPILIIFFIGQRSFIKGIVMTGGK